MRPGGRAPELEPHPCRPVAWRDDQARRRVRQLDRDGAELLGLRPGSICVGGPPGGRPACTGAGERRRRTGRRPGGQSSGADAGRADNPGLEPRRGPRQFGRRHPRRRAGRAAPPRGWDRDSRLFRLPSGGHRSGLPGGGPGLRGSAPIGHREPASTGRRDDLPPRRRRGCSAPGGLPRRRRGAGRGRRVRRTARARSRPRCRRRRPMARRVRPVRLGLGDADLPVPASGR